MYFPIVGKEKPFVQANRDFPLLFSSLPTSVTVYLGEH